MNRESMHTDPGRLLSLLGALGLLSMGLANAQVPVDDNGNPIEPIGEVSDPATDTATEGLELSAAELEDLVGPVALYPDDLLAIVLPASTYPLEIVQAARFLQRLAEDSTLKPDEDWDESIIALLNYPEVVNMMNDDIDWTWKLGEAVVAQQNDLIAAVETFRDRAYAAGNLKTDQHQTVSNDDGVIEIAPAEEDVIYVPYYEPEQVVVYSPRPVYHYYPSAYPVYYYPYTAGHYFGSGFFWGVSTAFTIGWANDYLHVYHNSYQGHPYYGHTYYGNHYWHNPSIYSYNHYYVNNRRHRSHDYNRHGDYWRPRHRGGARPVQQVARNTYYSGNGRTVRPATTGNRSQRQSVQFRQRSENTYVGTVAPRLQRSADNSARQARSRSGSARGNARDDARGNAGNGNPDNIRFRTRESVTGVNSTARQTTRRSAPARVSQRSRATTNGTTLAAANTSRSLRSTSGRAAAVSARSTVRSAPPARVRSTQRPPTVRSQPQRATVNRPAPAPRRAQAAPAPRQTQAAPAPRQATTPKTSSQNRSAPRSSAPARSSKPARGRSRSGGKRK